MKTNTLTGLALDWAVALADGNDEGWLSRQLGNPNPETRAIGRYSTEWSEAGPIIEREWIAITRAVGGSWVASSMHPGGPLLIAGPTPLIAAMRCYAVSRLGEEVDVPRCLSPTLTEGL